MERFSLAFSSKFLSRFRHFHDDVNSDVTVSSAITKLINSTNSPKEKAKYVKRTLACFDGKKFLDGVEGIVVVHDIDIVLSGF